MALVVKHNFQTALPDDPTKDVSANEWNDAHALTGVLDVANGGTGTTTGAPGVLVSDTPPVGAPDNSLWWESDSGLLYLRFNDGTSTQWVMAAPQPDLSTFASVVYVDTADVAVKAYADAGDAALTTSKVAKAGDTMTGDLTISKPTATPQITLNASVDSYIRGQKVGVDRWVVQLGDTNFALLSFTDAGVLSSTPIVTSRATGLTVVGGDPTSALGVATKQYVDAGDALKVNKAGDTMTGNLTPAVNGAVNLGSATLRWGTVFTSDLDLNNGVGDWTIVEGEDELFIHNNKRGKTYKFVMVEVDPSRVPPKKV